MIALATMVAALVALLSAGIADVATIFAARQQAIVAGDAAALAAADAATWLNDASPIQEAQRLANANHASLVSCSCEEGSTFVSVRVRVAPRVRFIAPWMGYEVAVTRRAMVEPWVPTWSPE